MNKKHVGNLYFAIGIIWLITGVLNAIISRTHLNNKTPLGFTYIGLAIVCICLAIVYISLGIKKKNTDKEDSE